jgi:hypothetical protein
MHRKRPGRRRAADQPDKLASPHVGSQTRTTALHPAETATLTGIETIAEVHSQCLGWVDSVEKGLVIFGEQ